MNGGDRPGAARRPLPWLLLAAAVAYAFFVHHGLGPRPEPLTHWWSPRGFLTRAFLRGPLHDWASGLGIGFWVLWAPALALAAAVFATTRSSLLRLLGVTAALAAGIFLFQALSSDITRFAWSLFRWRASATMLGLALVGAGALVSPWLAASWLKLRWPARIAWYLPVFLALVAVERNVTGTNPRLPFAISPWPVVQVIGLETLATSWAAQAAGVSIGLLGLARLRRERDASRLAGGLVVAAGLAVPVAWLWLGSRGLLPFRAGPAGLAGSAMLCALLLAAAAVFRIRLRPHGLRYRGLTFGTGALLLAAPLFVGQAWARWDYSETRDVRAQRVIDALQAYYERELVYPDSLDELVQSGDLAGLERPRIGFAALADDGEFTYQAFGTSYLLEFSAPRWVQCAYNPPYEDEDEEEAGGEEWRDDDYPGDPGTDALPGSWSCPSTPPELW